jgi:hypothetical protein
MALPIIARLLHSEESRALFAHPGIDVSFLRGSINGRQLASARPSHVNPFLIQSRGRVCITECDQCAEKRHRTGALYPFSECVRKRDHFGGCCGICKFNGHALRCFV